MPKAITAFDAEFPFRLPEESMRRLEFLRATLGIVTALAGQCAHHNKRGALDLNHEELADFTLGLYGEVCATISSTKGV